MFGEGRKGGYTVAMLPRRLMLNYWGWLFVIGLPILILAGLMGCSTGYKPEGFGGGYSEIPLSGDTYQVSVRGNRRTSADKVRKLALVRAADITVQHGYERFAILGMSEHQTKDFRGYTSGSFVSNTSGSASVYGNSVYGNATTVGTYDEPEPVIITNEHAQFTIRMLKAGTPDYERGLDAKSILAQFGPEVGRE